MYSENKCIKDAQSLNYHLPIRADCHNQCGPCLTRELAVLSIVTNNSNFIFLLKKLPRVAFGAHVCYHCWVSPPRLMAQCRKMVRGDWTRLVLICCFRLSTLFDLYLVFACLFSCTVFVLSFCMFIFLCCFVCQVKWLAVKTASEMTYCVSGGALNSTHSLTLNKLYTVLRQLNNKMSASHQHCTVNLNHGSDPNHKVISHPPNTSTKIKQKTVSTTLLWKVKRLKPSIALNGKPITELRSVTCHIPHPTLWPQPSASDSAGQSPTLCSLQIHLLTYLLTYLLMGSHSVTCHPTQANMPRHNPSQAGRYSIYLPQRDGRLSWPRLLCSTWI